jgi:hypothetical protein
LPSMMMAMCCGKGLWGVGVDKAGYEMKAC